MNNLSEILEMTDGLTIDEINEFITILATVCYEYETNGTRISASEANDMLPRRKSAEDDLPVLDSEKLAARLEQLQERPKKKRQLEALREIRNTILNK